MFFRILQSVLPFVWLGALGAISFMEAPLKFTAPNITLPLGLGIGRIVFHALNRIEIVFSVLMLVSFFVKRPKNKTPFLIFAFIFVLLLLETVWLLPFLDARAEEVIKGSAAPASNLHLIYIFFDAIKFFLLLALGIILTRRNMKIEG